MSETRKYRKFAARKAEIVSGVAARPKTMVELCRDHDMTDSLLRKSRKQFGVDPV